MTTELFRTYDASSVTITDSETTIYEEGGLSVLSTVKIYLKNTGSKALADFSIYGKTPDGNYEDITPAGKWYTNYNTAQTLAGSDTELTVTFDFTSYNKLKITGTCGASDTTTIEYEIHGTNINTNISEQQVFNTTSNRQEVEVYTTDDEPVKIGLKAVNAQPTPVDAGDRVNAIGNLFGELILAGYDYATEKIGISESDPLDEHYVAEELIDDTNLAADTYYYPSSDGFELGNFKDISVQFGLSGGVTFTVEAKIDNSTDWLDITKAGCELNTDTSGNASFVDTDGILQFENLNVRNVRYKIVTSDTTNALQLHHRKKSL